MRSLPLILSWLLVSTAALAQSTVVVNTPLVSEKIPVNGKTSDSSRSQQLVFDRDSTMIAARAHQEKMLDSLRKELIGNRAKVQKDIQNLIALNDTTNGKINLLFKAIDSITVTLTKLTRKAVSDSIQAKKSNCLDYLISGSKMESGGYQFTISDTAAHSQVQFNLAEVSKSAFADKFNRSIAELMKYTHKESLCDSATLNISRDEWYQVFLEASANFNDQEPLAGTLKIIEKRRLNIYTGTSLLKAKSLTTVINKLRLDRIHIQFQDGNIENIAVYGTDTISNRILKFENRFAIPFSSKRDYANLSEYTLAEKNYYERQFAIKIGDLLKYHPALRLYTRDYSPKNQVIDTAFTPTLSGIELKKENTRKILQAKVFTDLLGISPEKPNGLIQTEVSKRILINSFRHGVDGSANYGLFNFVTPTLQISKIEDKLKRLELLHSDPVQDLKSVTITDIISYQNYKLGATLNLSLLDLPTYKSTFYANTAFYYGRTAVRDSLGAWNATGSFSKTGVTRDFGVNNLQWESELIWQLQPEERYGIEFTYRVGKYQLLSDEFRVVRDKKDIQSLTNGASLTRNAQWYNNFELFAFIKPFGNENKLFFRYRMTNNVSNLKNNFNQTQIGYTFYLSKSNN